VFSILYEVYWAFVNFVSFPGFNALTVRMESS
jgi:hypothetical protein